MLTKTFTNISSKAKGAIIGKGGSIIKEMSERNNVSISLINFRNGHMDVSITGSETGIIAAFKEIKTIVDKYEEKQKKAPSPFRMTITNIPMKHYYYLVDLEQWITSPFAYIEESKLSVQAPLSIRLSYFQVRKDNWNQTLIIYIGSVTENRLSRAKDYIVSYINAYDKDDTEYQYKTNDPWYVYNRNFSRNVSFQYPEVQNQNTRPQWSVYS